MHSKLVKMAPIFAYPFKGGERVYFKVMSKKGRIKAEGFGRVESAREGMPSLWINGDPPTPDWEPRVAYPNDSIYIKASDVMTGRSILRIIGDSS